MTRQKDRQKDGQMEGQSYGQIKPAPAGATTNDLKLTDLTLKIEYLNKYIFYKNIYITDIVITSST